MILMIFSTVLAPQDPALTVESLAISATGRPPTSAVPVMTPSAGSPSAVALAKIPSSAKLPGSVSSAMRSRAKSLPAASAALWYFGAPPFSISARTPGRSAWLAISGSGSLPAPREPVARCWFCTFVTSRGYPPLRRVSEIVPQTDGWCTVVPCSRPITSSRRCSRCWMPRVAGYRAPSRSSRQASEPWPPPRWRWPAAECARWPSRP
jgi:hypothetical protein